MAFTDLVAGRGLFSFNFPRPVVLPTAPTTTTDSAPAHHGCQMLGASVT